MERPVSGAEFHYFFGDGHDAVGPNNITYRYPSAGKFKAYATSVAIEGPIATSRPVGLTISTASTPSVTITPTTPTSTSGGLVTVTTTLEPPDPSVTYKYDFGDNTPKQAADPNGSADHQYSGPGTYTVTSTATHKETGATTVHGAGGQFAATKQIVVPEPETVFPQMILIGAVLGVTLLGSLLLVRASLHAVFHPGTMAVTGIKISGELPFATVKFKPGAKPSVSSFRLL